MSSDKDKQIVFALAPMDDGKGPMLIVGLPDKAWELMKTEKKTHNFDLNSFGVPIRFMLFHEPTHADCLRTLKIAQGAQGGPGLYAMQHDFSIKPEYKQPENRAEYDANMQKNLRTGGEGFDTTMFVPCPFCAAPGWKIFKIVDSQNELPKESVCEFCKRGAKSIVAEGGKSIEVVQTSGPAQPEWLPPMRVA